MKRELYAQYFEPVTTLQAEGGRIGLATCKVCGAVVLLDPRDTKSYHSVHVAWHRALDAKMPGGEK